MGVLYGGEAGASRADPAIEICFAIDTVERGMV